MGTGKVKKIHGQEWSKRVDARNTIKIGPLKASDFKATERNTMQCVLARAINRHHAVNGREVLSVWVGANVVDVCFRDEPKVLYRYFLSPEDIKRVATFDRHPEAVKAIGVWAKDITITLVPPPVKKRLGTPRVPGKKRGSGNGPKAAPLRHLFAEVVK